MIIRLLAALVLVMPISLSACPWCKRYGIKETVKAGEPDPGGKIFGQQPPADKVRHYYIAAEPALWTWAPLGENVSKPVPLPPYLVENPTAAKVRYVQFTDDTFTQRVLDTPRLGILGPVLRGVVGEYIAVTFQNRAPWPLSIHPHGVRYDKDNEGSYAEPGPGKGAAVGPGATFTYVWQLDEASGPRPDEPSSKCWLYHSHCKDDEEINLGLVGLIVVTDPARARPDGTPVDVDRELVSVFQIFSEAPEDEAVEYANADLGSPMLPRPFVQTLELEESGARHSINGLMFGNLRGLQMREGERVRWYLGAIGEENGLHTAHWHGARLREEGRRTVDVVSLLPGETKVIDQLADNPGTWMFHCHVSDHMMEGMFANYVVEPKTEAPPADPFLGKTSPASLRWTQASVQMDFDRETKSPARIELQGIVSSYRGFFPMRSTMSVRVGGRSVPMKFGDKVNAAGNGLRCEVLGCNEQGVLLQEEMEFKLVLEGTEWRDALAQVGLRNKAKAAVEMPVELEIDGARHLAHVALKLTSEGDRLHGTLR